MVEWRYSPELVSYEDALAQMALDVEAVLAGGEEVVWSLEHPPLYTAGTSARAEDLLDARFPVYEVGRGGQYTYHGPGQRVVYVMLDLSKRGRDVRAFVDMMERWVIAALADFGVEGFVREGRVGVWVERADKPLLAGGQMAEDKIAAIGVRLKKWVSFHGLAVNIAPDLSHYNGIVPCGITEYGVTSFEDLGKPIGFGDWDVALRNRFGEVFQCRV